jgi:hypothetical protein
MPYGPITQPKAPSAVIFGVPARERGETLKTMREKLVTMLGGRDDLDAIQLNDWINGAYVEVATGFEFEETENMFRFVLDVNQPFYRMPEGIDYDIRLSIALPESESFARGRELTKLDMASYRDLPESAAYGFGTKIPPQFYVIWNSYLIVYPTPQERFTMTMDLAIIPKPMVNDYDSPVLQVDWHRAILLKAKQQVLEDTKNPQEALIAENAYIKYVQSRANRKALKKVGRIAHASFPGRKGGDYHGYDLGQNSGNPFVDRGSEF